MYQFLLVNQAVVSVFLTVLVLLQANGNGGNGLLGGSGGENYHTRKGIEKVFFYATIVLAVIFIFNSAALLLYQG